MLRFPAREKSSIGDLVVLSLVATVIYGLISFGQEWKASFHPSVDIDLSLAKLPYYTLLSAVRGLAAFVLSFLFTLVVGYAAAKSKLAEKLIIPLLDILQSIPVLGFLPGLVLALIAIFPKTNTGLELASIIMIFTGQVWNMTFSFYSSLKSLPSDFNEVTRIIGLSPWEKLWRVELPFSAMGLAWNSLLSMSGGWFFLSVCEAFTLGNQEYRLPGIGAYMAVAVSAGNTVAMVWAVIAMATLIILMDMVIWRPALAWAHQFRLEETGYGYAEPLIKNLIRGSKIVRLLQVFYRRRILHKRLLKEDVETKRPARRLPQALRSLASARLWKWLAVAVVAALIASLALSFFRLVGVLTRVPLSTWGDLWLSTLLTFLRVAGCLVIGSLWAVPVGIWIGTSPKRTQLAQPIIQVLASFPAPMLYPIALAAFFALGLKFDYSAMFLMLLGVQWYVLFNVLAGAMRIPNELRYAAELMQVSRRDMWAKLFLPSVFPALVTGWVTAAGGAWNASIVAEYLAYHGQVLSTKGLGSAISIAAAKEDFATLAASLTIMVAVVVVLNRAFWSKIFYLSQTRFRLDM